MHDRLRRLSMTGSKLHADASCRSMPAGALAAGFRFKLPVLAVGDEVEADQQDVNSDEGDESGMLTAAAGSDADDRGNASSVQRLYHEAVALSWEGFLQSVSGMNVMFGV